MSINDLPWIIPDYEIKNKQMKTLNIKNYLFCFSYYADEDTILTKDTQIICTDDDGRLSMEWIAKKIGHEVGKFIIESIQEI